MKRLLLMRHSIKTGPGDSNLSPEGVLFAKHIGAGLKEESFDRFFVSTLQRTTDTLRAVLEGMGVKGSPQFELFTPNETGSTEEALELWGGVCNRAEHAGKDIMKAALEEAPEVSKTVAKESAELFKKWFKSLEPESRVIVVGHSPFLELMLYGLTGKVLDQLEYCEGFWLEGDAVESLKVTEVRTSL